MYACMSEVYIHVYAYIWEPVQDMCVHMHMCMCAYMYAYVYVYILEWVDYTASKRCKLSHPTNIHK